MQGIGYAGDRTAEKSNRTHWGKAEIGKAGTLLWNLRGCGHMAEADLNCKSCGHDRDKRLPDIYIAQGRDLTEGEVPRLPHPGLQSQPE